MSGGKIFKLNIMATGQCKCSRRRRLVLDGFLKNNTTPFPMARYSPIADEFFTVGTSTTSFFKALSRMASLDAQLSRPIFRVRVSSFCCCAAVHSAYPYPQSVPRL